MKFHLLRILNLQLGFLRLTLCIIAIEGYHIPFLEELGEVEHLVALFFRITCCDIPSACTLAGQHTEFTGIAIHELGIVLYEEDSTVCASCFIR